MRKNEKLEMNIVSKIRKFDENYHTRDFVLPRSQPYIAGLLPEGVIDIQIIGSKSSEKEIGKRMMPELLHSVSWVKENERLQFAKDFCFPNGVFNRAS